MIPNEKSCLNLQIQSVIMSILTTDMGSLPAFFRFLVVWYFFDVTPTRNNNYNIVNVRNIKLREKPSIKMINWAITVMRG